MKKISIVLATYNGERFLAQQIDSLLAQDYPDFEIVACDDCSGDSTLSILEDFCKRYSARFKVLRNERNIGYIANFERGIRAAAGDYIALCDQDDVWLPGKLRELSGLLDVGARLAFCDLEIVDEKLRPLGYGMWKTLRLRRGELVRLRGDRPYSVLMKRNVASGCGMLIRRDIAFAALPFPPLEAFVHDQWLALVASFLGPIAPCPKRLVLYRQHSSQQTGGTRGKYLERSILPETRADYEGLAGSWEMLFDRLAALGVDHEKIAWARAWIVKHIEAMRRRNEEFDAGTILFFIWGGVYSSHFSGMRSLAKDALRLARMRRVERDGRNQG